LAGLTGLGVVTSAQTSPKMKLLIKSAWGSGDPTQAAFPFHHANAFSEAGHDVQIFLLGEAVTLMRTVVANAVVPVGWPPLSEALEKVIEHRIPIHV
jgi:predicted peroxiredoxin